LPKATGSLWLILKAPDRQSLTVYFLTLYGKEPDMKLSIILPVHNGEKYIRQTLDMIRLQSFPSTDCEIIVVLDGCTDLTPQYVADYATAHPDINLKIINNKKCCGVSMARNTAINAATGEYINFLDADDIINTDFYLNLYDAAKRTDADIAVASYINERWLHDSVVFNQENVISNAQDKLDITRADQYGYSWRYLIRRDFWNSEKLMFPTDLKYCEDMYPITRMIYKSNRIVTVPSAIYTYKFRKNSMLTHKTKDKTRDRCYSRAKSMVYSFLGANDLQRTVRQTKRTWWRLFDIFPIFVVRENTERNRHYVRLFGIIPILKTSQKTKSHLWRV